MKLCIKVTYNLLNWEEMKDLVKLNNKDNN